MKIAVRSRLKLFHRPAGLAGSAAKAPDRLQWDLQTNDAGLPVLRIRNPTPFHVTLARIGDDALAMRGEMVAPFGALVLPLDGAGATSDASVGARADLAAARAKAWQPGNAVRFEFLNDAGGAEVRTARVSAATP